MGTESSTLEDLVMNNNFWKDKKLTANDQQYWIAHGVDQLLHMLTYVGIVILCV